MIGAEDEPVENVAMCFADLKKKKKHKTMLCSKAGTQSGLLLWFFMFYSDRQCMNIKYKSPFTEIKVGKISQNRAE